jgi:hypothetical protein
MFLAQGHRLFCRGNEFARFIHVDDAEMIRLNDIVGNVAQQLLKLDIAVVSQERWIIDSQNRMIRGIYRFRIDPQE